MNATNVYYNPINDHFYEYVSSPASVYAWRTGADKSLSAFHLAEQRTLNGMTGYLATVTNAQEQRFIYNNFPNTNIWMGGTDDWQVINERCAPSISNKALTSNVATLTTSTQHVVEVDDSITIAGVDATFNGTFTVTAATSTTFSYAKTASDVASTAVGSGASVKFANQSSAEGSWLWVSGPTDEKCTRFTQGATGSQKWIVTSSGRTQDRLTANVSTSRYENWCNGNGGSGDTAYTLIQRDNYGEPNGTGDDSSNGEQFLLEKWGGSACWNDWGRINDGQNTGFLVEYGGAGSTSNAPSATVSAIVDNAPKNVTAARATPVVSGSLNVLWTAPATGTVTSYTATSTPGSLTCTSATTSCTVTGLTNGTSYTFTVTATFNDSTTKTSTASAAAIPDDGTTPTVTVTTARIRAAASATVRSTKTGTAYLVKDTVTVTNKASITGAADSQWNQVSITAANTDTSLAATGLVDGTYKAYAVDAIDNLSAVSTGTVTVDSTAPTSATLAAAATTSSSSTITFTVTGSEDLDCTTLSTTAGTDFTLTGISAISSIAQTSGTVCTIT
ncbi:MAG: fibronectin type III domain-containing protein, partial [Actinomycetota bacterium]